VRVQVVGDHRTLEAMAGDAVVVEVKEAGEDEGMQGRRTLSDVTRVTSSVSSATLMGTMQIVVPEKRRRKKHIMPKQKSMSEQCYLLKQQSWDSKELYCRTTVREG
jgi:hypothetical protein